MRPPLPLSMKKEMTAFDIMAICQEMQALVGGFVDKVFLWDGRNVLFRINRQGEGKSELYLQDGHWLHLASEKPTAPDTPSNIAVHLRKLVSNARVRAVEQVGFDRIIRMKMSNKEYESEVIFEVFGEGNLIITQNGRIVNALEQKKWKHRDIIIGADYVPPPPRFDPKVNGKDEFLKSLEGSTADCVRTMATASNLGGLYAEETCLRAGIDKSRKVKTLDAAEREALWTALSTILEEMKAPRARTIYLDGKADDFSPIALRLHAGRDLKEAVSTSQAMELYLKNRPADAKIDRDPELERLLRQKEQQEEGVAHMRAEAEKKSASADLIYTRYAEVSKLLDELRPMAGAPWVRIKEMAMAKPGVVSVEPEKHRFTLDIDGGRVTMDYTVGIEENADLIYSESKEMREKMRGAEEALLITKAKVADAEKKGAKRRAAVKEDVRPTKQFWFESYKWFIGTGERLVLSGRDARSNEQLVKKHLDTTDRYAHADLHGAPSLVIKDGNNASEVEMREVCHFALAHSKAWSAGVSEGSAYWVLPDQVSKTPQAGEFVAKGGFIIRGKRNYEHHLPLRLALGEVEVQGTRKIMCGPEQCVTGRSSKYVIIEPGDGGKMASDLSKLFTVPEEEIARILPPGKSKIVERKGV
jgi:predicted ribosome quality control (RQC) complex YloA/Tae2 family protein